MLIILLLFNFWMMRDRTAEYAGCPDEKTDNMQREVAAQEAKLLRGLTREEIESLYHMLQIMYENVE